MKIFPEKSICHNPQIRNGIISFNTKNFTGFHQGVNKENEYSWFYILALQGKQGESVSIDVNLSPSSPHSQLTRNNSLSFWSSDGWRWNKLSSPVWTDHTGLPQRYTFYLPTNNKIFLSNTIFFDYHKINYYLNSFLTANKQVCTSHIIGKSLDDNDLQMISFTKAKHPQGRILVTTGCHPAEPDIIASFTIMNLLSSPEANNILEQYIVDIMPMQNPDGFSQKSCLTSNGINLYWNFMKDDKTNCPEAYYLWQYIKKHPPFLYLDFHTYVHQYHRHPMPYIKPFSNYTGAFPKKVVNKMDKFLINESNGYFRTGNLATWPNALSNHITNTFNTIAYTKYHFNLSEGLPQCRRRALNIFYGLTKIALDLKLTNSNILSRSYGQVNADITDTAPFSAYSQALTRYKQARIYVKSYSRYYRHRNKSGLYR